MMNLRKIIVTIGLWIAFGATGFCCSCVGGWTAESAFQESASVFTGRIDHGFLARTLAWFGLFHSEGLMHTVRISEVLKGVPMKSVYLYSMPRGGSCGDIFEDGVDYLIYAYRDVDDRLWTDICTGTKPVRNAEEVANLRLWKRGSSGPKTGR